jgi:hypothetical protein
MAATLQERSFLSPAWHRSSRVQGLKEEKLLKTDPAVKTEFAFQVRQRQWVAGAVSMLLLTGASRADLAPTIVKSYGELPLVFEPNRGQADHQVKFLAHGPGYNLLLCPREALLVLQKGSTADGASDKTTPLGAISTGLQNPKSHRAEEVVLGLRLVGSVSKPEVLAQGPLPGRTHYYIGNNPAR